MPYIPSSPDDKKIMLDKIGCGDASDLFKVIPQSLRLTKPLDLPPAMGEVELMRHLEALASANQPGCVSFVGGGLYNHYIPAPVWSLAMRPEFATAYTPYQAEVAQGTLQVIYEFQTHICRLTGMDVANASLYDGATAVAEAAILAVSYTHRSKVVISSTVNPNYINVLRATLSGRNIEIVTLPRDGDVTSTDDLTKIIDDQCACLIMAQPNFFGTLEDLAKFEQAIHDAGGLFVQQFDPISLGIIKTPVENQADIAIGEGQPLGIPVGYGGPLLGLFACRKKFVRKIPGRLVARTVDSDGKDGFVLTLQTREQHIRRDKATSNICSNQALCATAATIYMSLLGKTGFPQVARISTDRAHYLADKICRLAGFSRFSDGPFLREFVIKTPLPSAEIIEQLSLKGISAGIDLGRFYAGMDHHLLIATTEMNSVADCDQFAESLAQVATNNSTTRETVKS